MRSILLSLLCALALSGCATVLPQADVPVSTCAQMPPIQAELLQPERAEFLLRYFGAEPDRISRKLAEAQAQLKICAGLNQVITIP